MRNNNTKEGVNDMFITSDPHLGHAKIAEIRGFATVEEHDAAIVGQITSLPVGVHLWILGDISSGSSGAEKRALATIDEAGRSRNLTMHLVTGNHDSVSPIHKDSWKNQRRFMEVFDSVQHMARRSWKGQTVWMSHFPFFGTPDAHSPVRRGDSTRIHDDGQSFLVHGHQHSSEVVSGPRSVDAGLDASGMKIWQWDDLMGHLTGDE